MIRLHLSNKPKELTSEVEEKLIAKFKSDTSKSVWHQPWMKESVLLLSHGKCAYSEVKLQEEGKDMQIDHFYPKSIYSDKVVEWGNLLPSVNHCNRKKKDIDPNVIPLINPLLDDPKEHLFFIAGMLYNKTTKGLYTINNLGLNDQTRLMIPRTKFIKEVCNSLKDIEPWKTKNINFFIKRFQVIMSKGTMKKPYSAAIATYILANSLYLNYKEFLQNQNRWDNSFQKIEDEIIYCSLPK